MSVPQSTAYTVLMKAYLSSDHVSPATGKTLAVQILKAGGAFANPSAGAANATEVANGWYSYALSTTDTNTVGDAVVRLTGTGVDDAERLLQIVNAATGGLGNLDAAVSTRTKPADTQARVTLVDTLTTYTGDTPQTGDAYARLGLPAGASVSADVAAVKGDTGTILTDVNAGAGAIYTRLGAPIGASLAADIAACSHPATAQTVDGSSPMAESYSAGALTLTQALYEIAQVVGQFSIGGTTLTFQRRDKTSAAGTYTLNDAANPTARTRAT